MKVIDIYREGLALYSDYTNEEYILSDDGLDKVFFVNRTLSDLKKDPVSDVNSEIEVNTKTAEALICGVAYYLSIKYCRNDKAAFLCDMYNSKRSIALSGVSRIRCSSVFKQ